MEIKYTEKCLNKKLFISIGWLLITAICFIIWWFFVIFSGGLIKLIGIMFFTIVTLSCFNKTCNSANKYIYEQEKKPSEGEENERN